METFTLPDPQRGDMEFITLSHPHWEALTDETQQAFHLAARLPFIQRYYLAGGTGLALYLGHRFSVDLDFFSSFTEAVGPDERASLREALDESSLTITFDKDMTFVANWRGVGISFFRLTLYPLVQPPLDLEGVPIASFPEIGANAHPIIISPVSYRGTIWTIKVKLVYIC
jgi:hypothetical protein